MNSHEEVVANMAKILDRLMVLVTRNARIFPQEELKEIYVLSGDLRNQMQTVIALGSAIQRSKEG